MLNIAVAGASGRMGRMLIEAVLASDDCRLSGALDTATSALLGQDAATGLGRTSGVTVVADLHSGLHGADVLIDFTRPEGTLSHLAVCAELGVRVVGVPDREDAAVGVGGDGLDTGVDGLRDAAGLVDDR